MAKGWRPEVCPGVQREEGEGEPGCAGQEGRGRKGKSGVETYNIMCHQVSVADTKRRQEERSNEANRMLDEVATLER